ncbi:hypothetical protein EGR_00478 [Echinococcus granulosus]|uniref:Uncharacterized protein n=1 Tax=Echinococcus granulosus TaxID=6210 RepID=W6UTC1_ECHGR|nr:hypothetical protein EGR_00478 [Echinococcus granulosus]EUB64528.1 hypothetical protein EGR_00478 [Echinococcus granulosus]
MDMRNGLGIFPSPKAVPKQDEIPESASVTLCTDYVVMADVEADQACSSALYRVHAYVCVHACARALRLKMDTHPAAVLKRHQFKVNENAPCPPEHARGPKPYCMSTLHNLPKYCVFLSLQGSFVEPR